MAEVYVGTKFRTVFVSRDRSRDGRLAELAAWCRHLADAGLAPDGAGNASLRTARGFLVTRTGAGMAGLAEEDFVEVLACDRARRALEVAGPHEPSSESMLHAGIYEARPDVGAILHGHSDDMLRRAAALELPVTSRERPYGTPELVAEVLAALGSRELLLIRKHGFVAVGATAGEAGARVEEALARLGKLRGGPGSAESA